MEAVPEAVPEAVGPCVPCERGLLDLPRELLEHVLASLGTRSLLSAACTCRTLREVAAVVPLHPVMTQFTRMARWLEKPHVAARVRSLTVRRAVWGLSAYVGDLHGLERLTIAFAAVRASFVRRLPPSVQHLDLHRLDCLAGDVFDTACLSRLPRLRTLKLTFTPEWDEVVVRGLDALPELEHVTLRQAPLLFVRCPIRARTVRLHATSFVVCDHPVTAEDLEVVSERGTVPSHRMLTPESVPGLRALAIECSGCTVVPECLGLMTRLERLRLRSTTMFVGLRQLARLPALRELELHAALDIATTKAGLPRTVAVAATVGGVPVPRAAIQAMFHAA